MSTKEVVMTEEWNESDDFKRIGTEGLSGEDIGEKSLTYWADVWRRFRENKLAIFGLILLAVIVVILFIGPVITGQNYQLIDASIKNQDQAVHTGSVLMIWEEISLPVSVSVDVFQSISVYVVHW